MCWSWYYQYCENSSTIVWWLQYLGWLYVFCSFPVAAITTFACHIDTVFLLNFDIWDKERKKYILGIFFLILDVVLPKASFGFQVSSLPACVHVSVNHELVCMITRHKFKLESPNLDQKMQNIWLKFPIVFRTDWAMHSMSNFTFLKYSVYLHRFCIFEIFVRHACRTVPHPTWLRSHSPTSTSSPTGSHHRLWNCLAVYLGETIGVQPIGVGRECSYRCRFINIALQYIWDQGGI